MGEKVEVPPVHTPGPEAGAQRVADGLDLRPPPAAAAAVPAAPDLKPAAAAAAAVQLPGCPACHSKVWLQSATWAFFFFKQPQIDFAKTYSLPFSVKPSMLLIGAFITQYKAAERTPMYKCSFFPEFSFFHTFNKMLTPDF